MLEQDKIAPRKAYGVALQTLGHLNPHIVVLDGDVQNSTYAEYFAQDEALQERYIECRIAELTLENNYGAGIGSAVADALSGYGQPYRLVQMHVRQIPKSGRTPDDVLHYLSLDAEAIVQTTIGILDPALR